MSEHVRYEKPEVLDALPAHQVRTRPPLSRVMDASK